MTHPALRLGPAGHCDAVHLTISWPSLGARSWTSSKMPTIVAGARKGVREQTQPRQKTRPAEPPSAFLHDCSPPSALQPHPVHVLVRSTSYLVLFHLTSRLLRTLGTFMLFHPFYFLNSCKVSSLLLWHQKHSLGRSRPPVSCQAQ